MKFTMHGLRLGRYSRKRTCDAVESPIEGVFNGVLSSSSISDPDGNVTSIIWNQEDESACQYEYFTG